MLRKILIMIIVLMPFSGLFAQSGAIQGKVLDKSNKEPIPFANVVVEQSGTQIGGGTTDFDGNYKIKPVPAGKLTVKVSCVGYSPLQVDGVVVMNDKVRFLDLEIETTTQEIEEVTVVSFKVPLIEKDNTTTGGNITSEDISKMSGRSAEAVAATVGGIYQENGQVVSVRGARTEATTYYIDGVKVRGSKSLPKAAIEQVSVVTGGLGAKYGDATGGIISITTKGTSRETSGGVEFLTSHFLDPYNENLLALNVSGPLFFKKVPDPYDSTKIKKIPVVGYFISGELSYTSDDNPSAIGMYKVKDNIYDSIVRNPILSSATSFVTTQSAEYLRKKDFDKIDARKNVAALGINVSSKFDFSLAKNLSLTLGVNLNYDNRHSYQYQRGEFSEVSGGTAFPNHFFNWDNYPQRIDRTIRAFAKINQRFTAPQNTDKDAPASVFNNMYYSIQADFTKFNRTLEDDSHKDDFFHYGYIGKFHTYKIPSFGYGSTEIDDRLYIGWIQNGFVDTLVTFDRSEINPELANYTTRYYSLFQNNAPYRNFVNIVNGGGLINGQTPPSIYNLLSIPGAQFNDFQQFDNQQFRFQGEFAMDIKDHEVSFGFEYEKRNDRMFRTFPVGLWTLARSLMNSHILELSTVDPVIHYVRDANGNLVLDAFGNPIFNDTISYERAYNSHSQAYFDINFRKNHNIPLDSKEWIDIDDYDPSELKLEYFSADELLNGGNPYIAYYGYNHYGKKLTSDPSFEDFFTATFTDEVGNTRFKREVPPFKPIYFAGYIQDKFAFADLVFNIGLRVDRFDANQKVLKDPFIMFEYYKVGDNHPLLNQTDIPDNIPQGAAVYVDNIAQPANIQGYRMGDTWYDAQGGIVDDPTDLYTSTGIAPLLIDYPHAKVGNETFLKAFTDYNPQVNLSPRISFSFPISDVAGFFAHYDILTRRPGGEVRLDPLEYIFIETKTGDLINNPNLKSEKTIDYELGFQQKLGNTSALKISAFYREMRDMVQVINRLGAYPSTYKSYGNIDFGTVKGFTAAYDLRRTGNVRMMVSYTLQFANGTGSDATTGFNLIAAGQPNLRATLPLDFDQRHAISANVDYRFADGKDYNGPVIAGKQILANTGLNLVIQSGSGSPFTKREIGTNYVIGSVNGSVKPWRTTINLRMDKDIIFAFGKDYKGDKKEAILNIYIDISNVLNTLTILDVYSTTGNPDDDGFLSASRNQPFISNQNDPMSYRDYYTMIINNPGRYGLPRQFRLGASFSF